MHTVFLNICHVKLIGSAAVPYCVKSYQNLSPETVIEHQACVLLGVHKQIYLSVGTCGNAPSKLCMVLLATDQLVEVKVKSIGPAIKAVAEHLSGQAHLVSSAVKSSAQDDPWEQHC